MSSKISRDDKLKALNIENNPLPDKYLNIIYNECIVKPNKKKKKINKPINVIDKTSKKYVLLLKLVNKLLVAMNKKQITDLTDFVDIDRQDIISCDKNIILDMEKELFKSKIFTKFQGWYRKKAVSFNLNILRSLVKATGLKLEQAQRNVYTKTNDRVFYNKRMFYTIKNI